MTDSILQGLEAQSGGTAFGAKSFLQGTTTVKVPKSHIVLADGTSVDFATETTLNNIYTKLNTGTILVDTGLSQGLTDAQLRATPVPVSLPTGFATDAKLVEVVDSLGLDGGVTPANGTGVRGWLRSISDRLATTLLTDVTDKAARALGKVGIQVGGADVGSGNPVHTTITDNISRLLGVVDLSRVNGASHSTSNPLFADVVDRVGRVLGAVTQSGIWTVRTHDGSGSSLESMTVDLVGTERGLVVRNIPMSARLAATGQSTTAQPLNIDLPAVTDRFYYIKKIEIMLYSTAARTGNATPVIVTTQNLNGVAWLFQTAGAIGTCEKMILDFGDAGIRSQAANTLTRIACPVATAGIWRVNVYYVLGT